MINLLISVLPGIGWASTFFFLLLGCLQLTIYFKKTYLRSRSLALYCFFAAVFACEQFIVQARMFSPSVTQTYVIVSTLCFCLSLYYYYRSLSYYIAFPTWLYKLCTRGSLLLFALALVGAISDFFFETSYYFDLSNKGGTGNYFVDSYALRVGEPMGSFLNILSAAGFLSFGSAIYLLINLIKTTRDRYFIAGMVFSILAAVQENFLLLFTFDYFFPLIFVSNLFEAFRMSYLSIREYIKEEVVQRVNKGAVEPEKYQNSKLSEERIQGLALQVKKILESKKLYMNPNLCAEDVAKEIGVPAYQLSQVVNIGLKSNFFELLSQYRIEEVKKRLMEPENRDETIINIAYSCGFNSKSSFNTSFKKITGMTPSDYRRGH